jgi:RNA polymerase sigma-70 factor (ECF subfamily)
MNVAAPATRASLLIRIRDPNDTDAWRQFVQLYASVIYGFARKRGVQDADAADLMQEVLRSVAAHAGRLNYDPKKGSFRAWLYTVTRNKLYNFLSSQRHRPRASGDDGAQDRLEEIPSADPPDEDWDREYEQKAFAWAAERVKTEFQPNTWQAFWLTGVDGLDAKQAGAKLGMSPGAVYVAKSRVLARLKEVVQELQAE